jgi:hypothetical protein
MSDKNVKIDKLRIGYEGDNVPDEFYLPPCGIEDIDRAVVSLFKDEITFTVQEKNELKDVPVVYASGERFALVKRKKPLRDKNGTLILPIIAVARTGVNIGEDISGYGRGIGQDTGDLIIKRKLDKRDRNYQNLINKTGLKNQKNVGTYDHLTNRTTTLDKTIYSNLGTNKKTGRTRGLGFIGSVLETDLSKNIYEIIAIPFPEFFSATYEITFWTQYQTQMNQMLETLMSAYSGQGNQFKITTDKGYWFSAFVQNELSADINKDDYTDAERIIRYNFQIITSGYLINPDNPGQRSGLRKFTSAPQISFGIKEASTQLIDGTTKTFTGDDTKFALSDIEELDVGGNEVISRNQETLLAKTVERDPFSGNETTKYVRVVSKNKKSGETVYNARQIIDLEDFES